MSIRLIQITKDLNVGLSTIAEFLQSKGFDVQSNPNVRVNAEQHELVIREFGDNSAVDAFLNRKKTAAKKVVTVKKAETETPTDTTDKVEEKKEIPTEKVEDKKPELIAEPPKEKKVELIEVKVPEDRKPKIQVVDKIDLDKLSKPRIVKPTTKAEVKKVEVKKAEKKAEDPTPPTAKVKGPVTVVKKEEKKADKPEKKAMPKKTDEPFRLRDSSIETNIVVKGTIDLSAINERTRPARKSRAERQKEREQDKKGKEVKDGAAATTTTTTTAADDGTKRRRRIKKGRVDLEKGAQQGQNKRTVASNTNTRGPRRGPVVKKEVTEADVEKQIKETLARLSNHRGARGKGARYRRERREAESQKHEKELKAREEESKILKITEFVTVSDLANMMDVAAVRVISTCMSLGMMVSINQRLDAETINIVASEFGFETEYISAEVIEAIAEEEDKAEDLLDRAPIVTVMGHVDHGKTSLLDRIRQANVIAGEAGGITQHIGAYNVKLKSGRKITFLDTPGHEAFTAMRARGAQVTDVAIIIVAADDNVMPQTKEAINHASAAGVPIVFAINKIDKPAANPDKIKETLASMNYLVEEWGGKYQSQDISAKQGLGVDELLEKVLLEADILELKANPNRRASGSVIESSLDRGRGYLSTVLVQNGTLKVGDVILAGTYMGRVRALYNERNQNIDEVPPASPAVVLGLSGAPQAGDLFNVLESEQEAREIASKREQLQREQSIRTQKILTLDDIGRRIAIGNFQQLNVIVKGDVDGSIEALSDSLLNLSTEEIQINVIHKGVGQISESDVTLAAASDAIIIGFQVRPSLAARKMAELDGVDVRLYSIIYDAIEEVRDAMEGMLSPEIKEEQTGYVEVRDVFKISKLGTVAGCYVTEGKLKRANKIRLIRDGIVIYSGELGSLRRFKDDVKEVSAGYECGLNIHNFNDLKVGDVIEPFEEVEVKKTL